VTRCRSRCRWRCSAPACSASAWCVASSPSDRLTPGGSGPAIRLAPAGALPSSPSSYGGSRRANCNAWPSRRSSVETWRKSAVSAGGVSVLAAFIWDPALRQHFATTLPLCAFVSALVVSPLVAGVARGVLLFRDVIRDTSASSRRMCEDIRW
jgi:hypothetical protein